MSNLTFAVRGEPTGSEAFLVPPAYHLGTCHVRLDQDAEEVSRRPDIRCEVLAHGPRQIRQSVQGVAVLYRLVRLLASVSTMQQSASACAEWSPRSQLIIKNVEAKPNRKEKKHVGPYGQKWIMSSSFFLFFFSSSFFNI